MGQELAKVALQGARKTFGALLKAAGIVLGTAVVGGVAAGVAASCVGWGGFAIFGCVVGGLVVGGFGGQFIAKEYLFSKGEELIENAGKIVRGVKTAIDADRSVGPSPVANKELSAPFASAATSEEPAAPALPPVVRSDSQPNV